MAKDRMLKHTDNSDSPWWIVEADDKRRARLNCIAHLLDQIRYKDVLAKEKIRFPKRRSEKKYKRPPREKQRYVPEVY